MEHPYNLRFCNTFFPSVTKVLQMGGDLMYF